MPPLHCLLPVSALFAVSLAAQPQTWVTPELRTVHDWPEPQLAGSFRGLLLSTARLTADSHGDAVLLRATLVAGQESARDAFVLRHVARHHAPWSLGPAVDVAVLPGGTVGADAVLTLGPEGALRLHRWTAGQVAPQTQLLANWPGFRRLIAAPHAVGVEVMAIDAAGVRLRRATWNGLVLGQHSQLLGRSGLQDAAVMDWDGDGVPELVVQTLAGIFIDRWNQVPLTSLPLPGTLGVLQLIGAVVSPSASHGDLLVAAFTDGQQTIVSWQNAAGGGSQVLAGVRVAAVAVYDRDGDGDADLLLADGSRNLVHVLQRQATGFRRVGLPLLAGEAAPNVGCVAVAGRDLDGDGDGDVLALGASAMELHSFFDAIATPVRPLALYADLYGGEDVHAVLPLYVDLPAALRSLPTGATAMHLLVDGWALDPATGLVDPARCIQLQSPFAAGLHQVAVSLPVPAALAQQTDFQLQLQVAVALDLVGGGRRVLPSRMLHVVTDSKQAELVRTRVALELTGDSKHGGGDGGGDGNILGGKTGKHEIGRPPE